MSTLLETGSFQFIILVEKTGYSIYVSPLTQDRGWEGGGVPISLHTSFNLISFYISFYLTLLFIFLLKKKNHKYPISGLNLAAGIRVECLISRLLSALNHNHAQTASL